MTYKNTLKNIDEQKQQNIKRIKGMMKQYGAVFIGSLKKMDATSKTTLQLYDGNEDGLWDYSFCIPCFDRMIIHLLEEWNRFRKNQTLEQILKRIEILRGVYLYWK